MQGIMNHFASPDFRICYNKLSPKIQSLADEKFELLKKNRHHPSLHLKKIRIYWSVRAGLNYRALGIDTPDRDGIIWFWIGNHSDYEKLINPR
jgi:hypothetical protein